MHPAFNQLVGRLLYMTWPNPGVLVLFQIFLGCVNLILLNKLLHTYSVHKFIVIIINLCYTLCPYILFLTIYQNRDTVFSYLYSIITILLLLVYKMKKKPSIALHGILIFLITWVSLTRHNALPLIVLFPLCFTLVQPARKRLSLFLRTALPCLAGYCFVVFAIFPLNKVAPYPPSFPYWSFIQDVAGIISANTYHFSKEEYAFYSRILPFKYWGEYYDPTDRNILIYHANIFPGSTVNPDIPYFESNMQKSTRILFFTLSRNIPFVIQRHAVALLAMLKTNSDQLTIVRAVPESIKLSDPELFTPLLSPYHIAYFRPLEKFTLAFFTATIDNPQFIKFTSPLVHLIIFSFVMVFLAIRKKYILLSIMFVPTLVYIFTFYLSPANTWMGYSFFLNLYLFVYPCFLVGNIEAPHHKFS